MTWIITIIAGAVMYYFVVLRPGKLNFWQLAAKSPDRAYDWFVSEPCWRVADERDPEVAVLRSDPAMVGPFTHWVPKLGDKKVLVFGVADRVEESQQRFIQEVSGQ